MRTHVLLLAAALLPFCAGLQTELFPDDQFLLHTRLTQPVSSFFTDDYWYPEFVSGLLRPLGLCFLKAESLIFGEWLPGYRLVGLALHALATLLLYRLTERFFAPSIALFTALIFAVHPIHTEAVVSLYGHIDMLAAIAILSACLLADAHPLATVSCILAGILTKESAVITPALLFLTGVRGRRLVLYCLPLALTAAIRFAALGSLVVPADNSIAGRSSLIWAKSVVTALGEAIRLCFFPTGQTIYYGHLRESLMGFPTIELLVIVGAGITWIVLFQAWSKRDMVASGGWFLITFLPASQVLPIGVLVAERLLYLPAAAAALLASRVRWLALALILMGATASIMVVLRWRTQESLWTSTAAMHPASPQANGMAALELVRHGKVAEAEPYAESAILLNPRSPEGLWASGLIRIAQGKCQEGRSLLQRAAEFRPRQARQILATTCP